VAYGCDLSVPLSVVDTYSGDDSGRGVRSVSTRENYRRTSRREFGTRVVYGLTSADAYLASGSTCQELGTHAGCTDEKDLRLLLS
jgi:hypothetical protein